MCYKAEVQKRNEEKLEEIFVKENVPDFIQDYFLSISSRAARLNYWITIRNLLNWLIGKKYIECSVLSEITPEILNKVTDSKIIRYIPQVLFDYILGFGVLGLSGVFSKSKHGLVKGYIIGVIGRFICSFLSGWIFFAVYTPEFFNSAILYSVVYNGSYIGLEAVVTLVVISLPPVNKALAYVKNNLV